MINPLKNPNIKRYEAVVVKVLPGNSLIAEATIDGELREVTVNVGKSSILTKSNKILKVYAGDKIMIGMEPEYDMENAFLLYVVKIQNQQ